jgi:hypothetical protein
VGIFVLFPALGALRLFWRRLGAITSKLQLRPKPPLMGGKFYYDVWVNGGRELANEIIKKNEKDTHDAREEARRAEEAAECERRIGIVFEF